MATIMATKSLTLLPPTTHLRRTNHHITSLLLPTKPLSLTLTLPKPYPLKPHFSTITSSLTPTTPPHQKPIITNISKNILKSTQTLTALLTLTLTLTLKLTQTLKSLLTPPPSTLHFLHNNVTPLFFASIRDRPSGYLNTPLTVVASGMAKWLDIYSGVLMVRVLLSWFPNIPWDRQPLSAIRDLCDPYLNLFRNIIPPIFDTLDVSPLLAFAVLGTLGSILNSAKGVY